MCVCVCGCVMICITIIIYIYTLYIYIYKSLNTIWLLNGAQWPKVLLKTLCVGPKCIILTSHKTICYLNRDRGLFDPTAMEGSVRGSQNKESGRGGADIEMLTKSWCKGLWRVARPRNPRASHQNIN